MPRYLSRCRLILPALALLPVKASLAAPSPMLPWPDLGSATARSPGGGANDAALLVAIEHYRFLEDKPVAGAKRNVNDWQLYLTHTRGVPVENVLLLRDDQATREGMLKAAAEAASRVRAGGTLWFLFIGHGASLPDKEASGVLLGVDTQNTADSLAMRGVSQSELLAALGRGRQLHTVAILDSCFSGRSSDGRALLPGLQPIVAVKMDAAQATSTVLLAAAQGNEFAGPLPGGHRPAFSYLTLAGLRGWGDSDGDGRVTMGEAVRYARRALQTLLVGRDQTPEVAGPADGVAVVSANEAGPDLASWQRMMDSPGSERAPPPSFDASRPPPTPAPAPPANPTSTDLVTTAAGPVQARTRPWRIVAWSSAAGALLAGGTAMVFWQVLGNGHFDDAKKYDAQYVERGLAQDDADRRSAIADAKSDGRIAIGCGIGAGLLAVTAVAAFIADSPDEKSPPALSLSPMGLRFSF